MKAKILLMLAPQPEGGYTVTSPPKRGRLWFNDGSCVRLRLAWKDHVWVYDSCT